MRITTQLEHCKKILAKKDNEYDTATQFIRGASLMKCTKEKCLVGYLTKHLVSISDMADNPEEWTKDHWREKITDAINYLLLLGEMVDNEEVDYE